MIVATSLLSSGATVRPKFATVSRRYPKSYVKNRHETSSAGSWSPEEAFSYFIGCDLYDNDDDDKRCTCSLISLRELCTLPGLFPH